MERFLREPPSVRNAAAVILVATGIVVVAAGVLITVLDGDEYPDLETGLWWGLQTVTSPFAPKSWRGGATRSG